MHGAWIVEMWAVYRDHGQDRIEIAENQDGSVKIYAEKDNAIVACAVLGEDWKIETIWLLDKGLSLIAPRRLLNRRRRGLIS
jgi:hypothetical protein